MKRLDEETIRSSLATLDGWSHQGNAIAKRFLFKTYPAVIAFVNQVAALAEKHNHHPDLAVRYGEVLVTYTTHDAGGVTQADVDSAKRIDQLQS